MRCNKTIRFQSITRVHLNSERTKLRLLAVCLAQMHTACRDDQQQLKKLSGIA